MGLVTEITSSITRETVKKALEILSNSAKKSEFITNLPDSKTLSRSQIIKKLTDYYKEGKLVLVLGAGVSMGFGLPNWDTLLQKLMIKTIEKEESVSTILSKLFTNIFLPSPLIAGRYLQKYYEEKRLSFEDAVRKVLYEEININQESALMDEIINFCVAPGKSPNLDSIITYNFDDILEQRLSKIGVQVPYKPIYGIGIILTGNYLYTTFMASYSRMENLLSRTKLLLENQYTTSNMLISIAGIT